MGPESSSACDIFWVGAFCSGVGGSSFSVFPQAACGIVDGVLLGFSLAMASNCRTKECSVAAFGIVVLTDPRFVDDVALDDEKVVHSISGS